MGPVAVLNRNPQVSAHAPRVLFVTLEDGSSRVPNYLSETEMQVQFAGPDTSSEIERALRSREFDAVILNGSGALGSSEEVCTLWKEGRWESPLILLTDGPEEAAAAECERLGASDFVLKENPSRLSFALKRALEEKKLREENAGLRNALQDTEKRVQNLVEHAVYGIFQVGLDGEFVSANETLQKILACSRFDELQRMNLAKDVFRFPETFGQLLKECRQQHEIRNAECEWRRRDGGFVSVRLHLRLRSPGEAVQSLEGFVEDVTEMRALERQLQQAQKFETIGQLVGGIAHDFNNVLGAVLGWAEIGYDQSREHPQLAEYFAHIRQQADRAAALTRELLTFARKQTLKPRPVHLNEIIESLMSLFDKVIGKDIEIKVELGTLQPVKADPAQLEQVLMNICLNARDAMPDGGRLKLKTEMIQLDDSFCHFYPGVTSGTYVVLSIADTGTGMTAEVRERIFEPFFTTKEKGRGSGMGLATVYGIVRQHGGFIHVYSEVGQGTLFHVYLPAMENTVAESAREAAGVRSPKRLQGVETILLAEDHDSIRELVRQSLTRLGYQVLAAADGKQALKLAELDPPALAVLDVVMPQMGGAAAAAELLRRNPALPVLFTSGFSENANSAVAGAPGSHYLQKPYSPTSLASTIREILDS
jgi:two-component system, cell cycle sensor histidine kinase and response regulator CckA